MEREVIQRRKLHEEVAARLEADIHAGRYAEGDQLPSERELTERYGVGRPAVREALLSLEKMGLVAIKAGERARVTAPRAEVLFGQVAGAARRLLATPDGVRHFQEARLLFETALARFAARHASAADVAALERALGANQAALGDLAEFQRTDVAFHYVLAELPANPIFAALHQAMVEWLTEQRATTLRQPGADREAFEHHKRIFEAIRGHNADAAERAMSLHLEQVASLYWQTVSADTALREAE
jgi:DNA-binding FadR family transcriptional regulator